MYIRRLVRVTHEKRLICKEIRGLKAEHLGGPVTVPFVIPAQYAVYRIEKEVLQVFQIHIGWVDITPEAVYEEVK
jgi:hypothetical protein